MKRLIKWYVNLPNDNYLAYVKYMYQKTRLYCYAVELHRLGQIGGLI